MEYAIQELAALAGVTARTLRWYDRTGLLRPSRVAAGGRRWYDDAAVDRLQQILFYRVLGVDLARIKAILDDPAFDRLDALRSHLAGLEAEQRRVALLIRTVQETIAAAEREEPMEDERKFEAFKQRAVEENETRYGAELRAAYGDTEVDQGHARVLALTAEQYRLWKELDGVLRSRLEEAVTRGADPAGEAGQEIMLLHKRWLSLAGQPYDPARHRGLAMLYTEDARFTAYYDRTTAGCAGFLRRAVLAWVPA